MQPMFSRSKTRIQVTICLPGRPGLIAGLIPACWTQIKTSVVTTHAAEEHDQAASVCVISTALIDPLAAPKLLLPDIADSRPPADG